MKMIDHAALMPLTPLPTLLDDARDLRMLARDLGRTCVDDGSEIQRSLEGDPRTRELADDLEAAVAAVPPDWWTHPERTQSGFGPLLHEPSVRPAVDLLRASGPVVHLAVLRALCLAPLTPSLR